MGRWGHAEPYQTESEQDDRRKTGGEALFAIAHLLVQTDEQLIPNPEIGYLGWRGRQHERTRLRSELQLALAGIHACHGRHDRVLHWRASTRWGGTERRSVSVLQGQLGARREAGARDEPQAQREHHLQLHRRVSLQSRPPASQSRAASLGRLGEYRRKIFYRISSVKSVTSAGLLLFWAS